MKKIILILIILAILIGSYLYINNPSRFQGNKVESISSDESTLICGQKFYVQKTLIEGIDVTRRIIDLMNEESSVAKDKTQTNCYWLTQNFNLEEDGNVLKTEVEARIQEYVISITSVKKESFYLGEGFIIDKKTYDIYNRNAIDGERGNKIGNLKQ